MGNGEVEFFFLKKERLPTRLHRETMFTPDEKLVLPLSSLVGDTQLD